MGQTQADHNGDEEIGFAQPWHIERATTPKLHLFSGGGVNESVDGRVWIC